MILRVLNLILIVITFGLVEIIDTVTYDEIDNNITVTGYEDYTYRDVFGDSLYGTGKTNLIDNGDFNDSSFWLGGNVNTVIDNGVLTITMNEESGYHLQYIDIPTGNLLYLSTDIIRTNGTLNELGQIKDGNSGRITYIGPSNYSDILTSVNDRFIILLGRGNLQTYTAIYDNVLAFDLTDIFEEENEPTISQFGEMKTEYERLSALQPYEQVTTTRNTLDMTDLMISLVSLLCWYGIIKVWKGVRK